MWGHESCKQCYFSLMLHIYTGAVGKKKKNQYIPYSPESENLSVHTNNVTKFNLYPTLIGGGGLGVRPLLTFSSVYKLTYCIGGKGIELTPCWPSAILIVFCDCKLVGTRLIWMSYSYISCNNATTKCPD